MKILENIKYELTNEPDIVVLTAVLQIKSTIDIASEQYHFSGNGSKLFEASKKHTKTHISNIVFSETMDILRTEAHDMIKQSFKVNDYEGSNYMRECARKLLLMVSKMERPE